jgi:hypothetical protein
MFKTYTSAAGVDQKDDEECLGIQHELSHRVATSDGTHDSVSHIYFGQSVLVSCMIYRIIPGLCVLYMVKPVSEGAYNLTTQREKEIDRLDLKS